MEHWTFDIGGHWALDIGHWTLYIKTLNNWGGEIRIRNQDMKW